MFFMRVIQYDSACHLALWSIVEYMLLFLGTYLLYNLNVDRQAHIGEAVERGGAVELERGCGELRYLQEQYKRDVSGVPGQ